ncbi:hypothetical protein [Serratia fonticola]
MDISWIVNSATTMSVACIGAYLFHRLALAREKVKYKQEAALREEQRRQELVFISIELVFLLESFGQACAKVAFDQGESVEGSLVMETHTPSFDLSAVKGDWRVLPQKLMYDIRSIPVKVTMAEEGLNYIDREIGNDDVWLSTRQMEFVTMGIEALSLSVSLREISGLPDSMLIENEHGIFNRLTKKLESNIAEQERQLVLDEDG